MKSRTRFSALALLTFSLNVASDSHAYLGSFEPADGYTLQQIPGTPPSDFGDVTYYNAGQFGANAGGGSATQVVPDSGLWDLLTQPGAYFKTSATRSFYTGSAPPYPAFPLPSTGDPVSAYIVGHHSPGRTGTGALAVRNDAGAIGAMEYDYELDTYDFGGSIPSSIISGSVSTGFYFCPNPSQPSIPGQQSPVKFIMSFLDSTGNTGLQLGYARDNEVFWRPGSTGSFNYTGVIADATNWDGFTVNIDLTADNFGIDYYDVSTNLTSTLVASGTALGTGGLQDLTHLGWWLDQQVTGGNGGKNFFDDFSFRVNPVPEPSAGLLLLVGLSSLFVGSRSRGT